jgi:hypothetical protein
MLHNASAQVDYAYFSADSGVCNLATVNGACPRTLKAATMQQDCSKPEVHRLLQLRF